MWCDVVIVNCVDCSHCGEWSVCQSYSLVRTAAPPSGLLLVTGDFGGGCRPGTGGNSCDGVTGGTAVNWTRRRGGPLASTMSSRSLPLSGRMSLPPSRPLPRGLTGGSDFDMLICKLDISASRASGVRDARTAALCPRPTCRRRTAGSSSAAGLGRWAGEYSCCLCAAVGSGPEEDECKGCAIGARSATVPTVGDGISSRSRSSENGASTSGTAGLRPRRVLGSGRS